MESYTFHVHLLSLSIMFSRFIYLVACIRTLFLLGWIIFHFLDILYFVYPFISQWTFELLWTGVIIGVQVSESLFSITVGIKLGVEMLGQVVILFNFLRSHQRVLHSSCTILQFHPHPTVPIPPPPPPPSLPLPSPHHHHYYYYYCHPRRCKVFLHIFKARQPFNCLKTLQANTVQMEHWLSQALSCTWTPVYNIRFKEPAAPP